MADPVTTSFVLTWTSGGIFLALVFARMLAVGGTVEAIKKAVDTEVDPATNEAVTIFRDSTTRGVRAVTQAEIDLLASKHKHGDDFDSHTTITANVSKDRYFERPRLFSKLLPILPLAFGAVYGGLLVPISVHLSGMMAWPLPEPEMAVVIGCFVGIGEGASAGSMYKAWDSMDGWGGLLKFAMQTGKFLVRSKTGQPTEEPTGETNDGDGDE